MTTLDRSLGALRERLRVPVTAQPPRKELIAIWRILDRMTLHWWKLLKTPKEEKGVEASSNSLCFRQLLRTGP